MLSPLIYNSVNSFKLLPNALQAGASIRLVRPRFQVRPTGDAYDPTRKFGVHENIGIASPYYKPLSFTSNRFNEIVAVTNRVIKATPVPDPIFVQQFTQFFNNNIKSFLPKTFKTGVQEYSFEKYLKLSNATPSVKAGLVRKHAEFVNIGLDSSTTLTGRQCAKWTVRKSFIKTENLNYRSPCGEAKKAPRLIQGACPEFICLTGPWFACLQERIKRDLNSNNFVVFTSSVRSAKAANKLMEINGITVEDDVSAWDASYATYLCQLELQLCRMLRAPKAVQQLVRANINTNGVTTHGVQYKTGGMRKSGDPYTSLFNSLFNAMLHLFIISQHTGHDLSQLRGNVRMLVQGDDNIMRLNYDNVPNFRAEMLRAGFNSVALNRPDPYRAEFCSMRLVPVHGGHDFTPMAGKVLSKVFVPLDLPKYINKVVVARGIALGLYACTSINQPLKIVLDHILHLTKHVEAKPLKREEWQMNISDSKPTAATKAVLQKIYGYNDYLLDIMKVRVTKCGLGSWIRCDVYDLLCDHDVVQVNVYPR